MKEQDYNLAGLNKTYKKHHSNPTDESNASQQKVHRDVKPGNKKNFKN